MRIDGTGRTGSVAGRASVSRADGQAFIMPETASASRASASAPVAPMSGLDALLALQAVDDPLFAKKKAVRRGNQLLDTLDSIKADLLVGRVDEHKLNQLMALVTQARERKLPGLDAVLDDIELRAQVELAKFGKFSAA